jgi:uncharacterized membrane protein YbhN (UPF0104 family)
MMALDPPVRLILNVPLISCRYGSGRVAPEPTEGFFEELALRELVTLRRGYVLGLGLLVGSGVVLGATRMGRGSVSSALTILGGAQPGWLLAATVGFGLALLSSAAAWRSGLRACGGSACFTQVSARYAIGSLVNAVAPAHLGGALRLGLLSRTLSGEDRLWRAGGVGASIAAARMLALAILVVVAAAMTSLPLWPAPVLAVSVLCVLVVCTRISGRAPGRLGSLLQVFRSCARSPREGVSLVAWIGCSCALRLGAASSIAMALGVARPVWVALVLLAAIALAGVLPLTPGNIGAGAGAATLALHGTGVGVGAALALGIAFQAVETFAGGTLGLAGAAVLAAPGTRVRRWSFAAAGAATVLMAATLGLASVDLV